MIVRTSENMHIDVEVTAELWLVANAGRSKEDPHVTWPGDVVETRVSEAWSALVGAYGFLDDNTDHGTNLRWGDLQESEPSQVSSPFPSADDRPRKRLCISKLRCPTFMA